MPWPKGRPMPPETLAALVAGAKRARENLTPEERERRGRLRSKIHRSAWAEKSPEERAEWAAVSAKNLVKARACIGSVQEAARKAAAASAAARKERKAAEEKIPALDRLTKSQRADYWLFRGKEFDHDEALSLVETGMLPR